MPGVVEFVESLKRARVASLQADVLSRLGVDAVVQRNLQNLRRIQVARQQVGFLAEGTHLDAARAAALAGILDGLSLAHQFLDVGVGIEDTGIAVSLLNDPDACQQELIGRVLRNVDAEPRLQLVQLLLYLQDYIRQLVGGTVAFTVYAANIDVREIVVGAAFQGGDAHLRRCRLIVELYPEAGEQLLGRVACQRAFGNAFLIEGKKVLVDVAGIHRVPAVQLCHGAKMHKPVHLNSFPKVTRRMGRHPAAHLRNFL